MISPTVEILTYLAERCCAIFCEVTEAVFDNYKVWCIGRLKIRYNKLISGFGSEVPGAKRENRKPLFPDARLTSVKNCERINTTKYSMEVKIMLFT